MATASMVPKVAKLVAPFDFLSGSSTWKITIKNVVLSLSGFGEKQTTGARQGICQGSRGWLRSSHC